MKKDYILFIDSGIGGLSTLAKTMQIFCYYYIFFADNKHCPYGNHTKSEIFGYLSEIITRFKQKYSIKFVVIACNTATAAAIDDLRATFNDIIFIGTEPAIKLAAKNGYKNVFALTTPLTKRLDRYKRLSKWANGSVFTLSIDTLVSQIENYSFFPTHKNKFELLKTTAKICVQASEFDCIVLGCTHYVFLKPFFRQLSSISLVDGNEGIAKNLVMFLKLNNINSKPKSKIIIKLSSENTALAKKYKKILRQTLAN